MNLMTVFQIGAFIDVNPTGSPNWKQLGEGIDNFSEAMNEVVNEYQFLNRGGYATSEVTGAAPKATITGVRVKDDDAQNYILNKKYAILNDRKTNFKIEYFNEENKKVTHLFNGVTLANIQEFGGASTDGTAISFEIHYNGKPEISVEE